jgi:N,N'-diacetyllegionaminate synthase
MRAIADIFNASARPLLVAEVAQSHDGSLGQAHAFIDAVATTGADAIKFQTHIAAAESTPFEQFRIQFSQQDATRYDYWRRMEFTPEQWSGLKAHAEEKGLLFLSSPFSMEAIELLDALGMGAWKIASGELDSRRMIERMAATGKPLIASTGMSSYGEIRALADRLERLAPNRHAILHCTTAYPTPPEQVGMNVFSKLMHELQCPIGLSDHSGEPYPSILATWLGARVLEVHVTLSRQMFGPDVSSSLTIEQLCELARSVDFVHAMRQHPIDKDALAAEKAPLKKLFGKAAYTVQPLASGDPVGEASIAFRKPGNGLSESEFDALAGRALTKSVASGVFLQVEDFK